MREARGHGSIACLRPNKQGKGFQSRIRSGTHRKHSKFRASRSWGSKRKANRKTHLNWTFLGGEGFCAETTDSSKLKRRVKQKKGIVLRHATKLQNQLKGKADPESQNPHEGRGI